MVYFPSFFLVKSDLFVRKESRSEKEEEKNGRRVVLVSQKNKIELLFH